MRYLENKYTFHKNYLKNYSKFKTVLIKFREFFGLEEFNLKELDKYLWQFGKYYFPKTYYQKKGKTHFFPFFISPLFFERFQIRMNENGLRYVERVLF